MASQSNSSLICAGGCGNPASPGEGLCRDCSASINKPLPWTRESREDSAFYVPMWSSKSVTRNNKKKEFGMIGKNEACGQAKESESLRILSRLCDISMGFQNTVNELSEKLHPVSRAVVEEEPSGKDTRIEPPRPPLFCDLHEAAARIETQLSILRVVLSRVDI